MLLNSRVLSLLCFLGILFYLPVVLCNSIADDPKTPAAKTTTATKSAEPKTAASKTSQSKPAVPTPTETKSAAPKQAEICTAQKIRLRKEWCAQSLPFSRSNYLPGRVARRSLSKDEQSAYIKAVQCLHESPSRNTKSFPDLHSRYDDFVRDPLPGPAYGLCIR